jgi:uncharacterized protein (TIGR02597 family)
MKPSTPNFTASVAAALISTLCATASAQSTATTDPVGFFTLSVPAGPVNRVLSVPLYRPAVYTSVATAVTATTCNLSAANFGTGGGQTDVTTLPHLLRIKTGTQTGRFFAISAASGDQVTVTITGPALNTFLSVNDSCEIFPASTLGSVFGTSTPATGIQTNSSSTLADNFLIWNGSAWLTYFHNGANWRRVGSLQNQNNAIIYPDEGMFVVHIGTNPINVAVTGTVPTTTERTDLATSSFIPNRFPVDISLLNLGLHTSPNWTSGATANVADTVSVWTGSAWLNYFYNGSNWKRTGSLGSQDGTMISAGTAVFVSRLNATESTLTQTLPYVLAP